MNVRVQRTKNLRRIQRKRRIRGKISGIAALPRVSFFRSNRYLSAQAIDDASGVTLAAAHSKVLGAKANTEGAKAVAAVFAETLKEKSIETVVFDRNGYLYHGVVAAFAEALREHGIKF